MSDEPTQLKECAVCGAIGLPERIEAHDCESFISDHFAMTPTETAALDYRDPDTLHRLYWEEELTLSEIGERFDLYPSTIFYWMEKHAIKRRAFTPRKEQGTHRDETTLRRLYHDDQLTQKEVADELDVGVTAVKDWMNRYDIERRDSVEASTAARRKEYATFLTEPRGYEVWATRNQGGMDWMYVHRLLAVAEYGFEATCGKVVHHKNHIKWDNRPSNIELMTPSEHSALHAKERRNDA